ncbi:MAG TPA: hypothetical protein PKD86_19295, partial [Gemmatales bacterium]|nr:hypothetical protein [Gemmatales bacterium]
PGLEAADEGFWRALAADTQHNEGRRRRAVHELLAEVGPVRPEAITRRLYKEILGTDLDDPYLGLGTILDPKP